ncbi:MAG: type I DNA topoisomerase [SAR324 cluster bacterium]|nr:type I DNA topoisomerase [SAR324 cluster bacterium]
MSTSLVIVESPAKAKTINKYLGSDFKVLASVGHVKDLPKDRLGVDIENNFEPEYDVIAAKTGVLKDIKKAAKAADKIYLAADPDREGEAIAAHLAEEIRSYFKGDIHRLLLFEITKNSVLETIKKAGALNVHKYEAQKARRVLDRLVGYQISPLLWEKVRFGLSAGRVQSVAVRLICEREALIRKFKSEEYWKISAVAQNQDKKTFQIRFAQQNGKTIKIGDEKTASAIVALSQEAAFTVSKVTKKKRLRNPVAPFITSTLQQEAARKLSLSSAQTMRLAQQLYEGTSEEIGGLITYMRTDSLRISDAALSEVRQMITETYGKEFCPKSARVYKSKQAKKVQDAHEAIRPTSMEYPPQKTRSFLNKEQQRLYELIWNRFVASQMESARFDQTQVEITAGELLWRVSGSVLDFSGFLKLYEEGKDDVKKDDDEEQSLPPLIEGEVLQVSHITPKQHFTEPPPRYNQATLIKELEEKGIGRPSTFATIMETITKREYVERISNRFHPTSIGLLVNDLLVENFPEILEVSFTAHLENILDSVEEGDADWTEAIRAFYTKFKTDLETAQVSMRDVKKQEIPTDIQCSNCGNMMVVKWGKNGEFLACSNYPECKSTSEFEWDAEGKPQIAKPEVSDIACDKCGNPFIVKTGRYGKFYACSNYPECKNTRPLEEVQVTPVEGTCENCGSGLVRRKGRYGPFVSCAKYPDCKYIQKKAQIDTGIACPQCAKGNLIEKKSRRGKVFYSCSDYPKCKYALWNPPINEACPQCQFPILEEKQTKKNHFIKCPQADCNYSRSPEEEKESA